MSTETKDVNYQLGKELGTRTEKASRVRLLPAGVLIQVNKGQDRFIPYTSLKWIDAFSFEED